MATITNPTIGRALCLVAAGLIMTGAAHAQAYTPPPPPLTTAPCVPTKKNPCDATPPVAPAIPATADKFPFPGESPGTVPDIPTDGSAPGAPTPAAPAAGSTKPAPADQFPFPGETPNAPAAGGQKPVTSDKFPFPGEPADSASSSSSSSSSGGDAPAEDSADKPKLKDAGTTGSTRFERKHLAKVEDTDHRELEDLDVSHYYMTTGNFQAAYLRAQDALKLYPDDENAHIALAVSADKLKKKDEAVAEYRIYLKLAPDGVKAKEARRALAMLGEK